MDLRIGLVFLFLSVALSAGLPSSSLPWLARTGTTAQPTRAVAPTAEPYTTPASDLPLPGVAMGKLPDLGKFVKARETAHFSFFVEPDSYALQNIDDFAADAETLLAEMSERTNENLGQRVPVYLHNARSSDFSGLSFMSPPLIYLKYGGNSGRPRLKAAMGHELAHQITMQTWGYSPSLLHLEGIAQWASERYWAAAAGESFDRRVRRYLARSFTLPLTEIATNRSSWEGRTQMAAYDQSGSFVGHLIRSYGLDRFKRVYLRSNYEEVYGKSLPDLESDWLSYLSQQAEL